MSSENRKGVRKTAAWRLSIWTTLAFALGTALAFAIIYSLVADGIRQRTDAWLSGEAEVLADVAMNTPQDYLKNRIVEEVAELATREVPDEDSEKGSNPKSVFFLETSAENSSPLWIGPEPNESFLHAINETKFVPGVPQSVVIENSKVSFRVVASRPENGSVIYLGLVDRAAMRLLDKLTESFLMIWAGMVVLGFVIAYTGARRTLRRVERITETASQIGSDDLSRRLPDSKRSDEISRLARTFNQMLDRIQASVNELRTVTDAVAHDLKSPVTSIRGRLEMALSNNDDTGWREPVADAVEGLDRMAQLLNTTLDLAEAAGGALHLDRDKIDLSMMVRQLVDLYQPALAEHGHEVVTELQDHIVVDGDRSLINRVIENLLNNELTHLPHGCRIAIRLAAILEFAELRIDDNGPGFPPELRQRAFNRFVKGLHSPGHGLGLAFVHAVVRAHGGDAGISDNVGTGASIILSLPLVAVSSPPCKRACPEVA